MMIFAFPFMILIWFALLAVPALALVWGARWVNLGAGQQPTQSSGTLAVCPACHQSLQPGWEHCAHCGQKLT